MKRLRTLVGLVLWTPMLLLSFLAPELEPARAANILAYGQPAKALLTVGQPSLTYTFTGKTGDKVLIAMNALEGLIDPVVQLYTPSNRLIGEDDNGGGKLNALLSGLILPEGGTYRVVCSNKQRGDGNFSLMITAQGGKTPNNYDGNQATDRESFSLSRPFQKSSLTYHIKNALPGFSMQNTEAVVAESFSAWAKVVPLTFTEVNTDNADIHIEFASIDGPANVLGQACPPSSPCSGEVQFDADETWTLRQPQQYDDISFLAVSTHEFGHIIGLLHSNDSSALMYPTYSPYNLKPAADDIRGAQALYRAGTGSVNGSQGGQTGGQVGNVIRSTINNNQWVTYWDFDVNAGETVTITMKAVSGNLDSFLVLLDANNHILAYADDTSGMNAILRNIKLPQTGTYTVAATRYQQAQGYTSGDYELSIDYLQ